MENPDMEEPQCSQGAEKETIQTEQEKGSRHKRGSSTPSQLSMKSDDSMIQPVHFTSGKRVRKASRSPDQLSMKGDDDSMIQPVHFGQGEQQEHTGRSSTPSQLSMKSDDSMIQPVHFTSGKRVQKASPSPGQLSMKGDDDSMIQPVHFCQGEQQEHTGFRKVSPSEVVATEVIATGDVEPNLCQEHYRALVMFCKTDQAAICKECAVKQHKEHAKQYIKISTVPNTLITLQNILDRMTASEFREFKRNLGYEYPECFETLPTTCSTRKDIAERIMESFSEDEVLKVTVHLASIKPVSRCQEKIKETLRRKFWHIHEGLALPKTQVVLYDTYTELYITEGGSDAVKAEHEVRLIEKVDKNCSNQENPVNLTGIFRSPSGDIRTVLTKGIAGIGKTISVQKFMLDWAENSANQDIDLIIPLFFRDLNLEKEPCSLIELMRKFFSELKEIESFENGIKILLVLDGLDECRIHLDFHNTRTCCDTMEPISMDVLLTNLIKGNLLPNSLLWITSRPAATYQIPSECVQRVTEVRGFTDSQKEEYFHKKCKDPHMANLMIKHVKSSRSMDIMCHIPIFCWITATVLDILIRDSEIGEIPKSQTQLYIHYLLIQTGLKNRKYQKAINGDLRKLTQSDKSMILNLAKLAFQGMNKNTLIFYEVDLKECGIGIDDAAEFSSLCTQLFREEFGLYRKRVFCFLHLSVQEHLAAIHVLNQFLTEGMNVLASSGSQSTKKNQKTTLTNVLKSAVVNALEDKFGHFDQFLRFLLGLSTECNRQLLQDLLPQMGKESLENDKIVQFIRDKIAEEARTETETINLIHCLKELGHRCLVDEIQESLDSGTICDRVLNPEQCSALAYVILMSKDVMEVFDLKKYKTTQASSRHRLLPIVRASKKAILCDCELSRNSCEIVASGLRIANSPVRELDLSHNRIEDDGFLDLCKGLKSPHCQLEILRLEACEITDKSCASLASAFESTPSSLQELDLSSNELTDKGVMMLEPWLKRENCKVQRLRLKQCRLTKSYCKHLTEVLTSSSTKKINLDLTGNY